MANLENIRNLKIWDIEALTKTYWNDPKRLSILLDELDRHTTERSQKLKYIIASRLHKMTEGGEMSSDDNNDQNRQERDSVPILVRHSPLKN